MDGYLFLYITWLLWVLVVFLMPKSKKNLWVSITLLLCVISNSFNVIIGEVTISATIALIIIGSVIVIAMHGKQIRTTWLALSVCIGYVGALMWEMVSPVWVIAPRMIIYAVLSFLLMFLITNEFWLRIAIFSLGSSVGEIIYSCLLLDYGIYEKAGDASYLDIVSIVIFMLVVTYAGSKWLSWFENTITQVVKRKARIKT